MGWFNKKEKKFERDALSLPKLPKLPELSTLNKPFSMPLNQISLPTLPSYPNDSFGNKFSQNAIKDAVSGEREEREFEDREEDEFPEREEMHDNLPLQTGFVKRKSMPSSEYPGFAASGREKNSEPLFIRMDKFEESLNIFENTKKKIAEMEEMLMNIKKIKVQRQILQEIPATPLEVQEYFFEYWST